MSAAVASPAPRELRTLKGLPARGAVHNLAESGERPMLRVVRAEWLLGDLRLRVRPASARRPPEGAFDLDLGDGSVGSGDGCCSCREACTFTPGQQRPCLRKREDIAPAEPGGTSAAEIGPLPALPRFPSFLEYAFFQTCDVSGRPHEWTPPDPKNDRPRSFPPRWTGCDDRACVDCGPLLEQRSDRAHQAMVSETLDVVTQDWTGELFGTGQQRTQREEKIVKARPSRAIGRSVTRIRRLLSEEDRENVLELLAAQPVRRCYQTKDARCVTCPSGRCRCDWVSEALLEIENPSVLVARREAKLSIAERSAKAIDRAQAKMRESNKRAVYAVAKNGPRRLHNVEGGGF